MLRFGADKKSATATSAKSALSPSKEKNTVIIASRSMTTTPHTQMERTGSNAILVNIG